jgi:hypothetical protein
MKPSPEILQELSTVAPNLPAGLPTPYQVPEGYFECFAVQMLEQVTPMAGQTSVPAGYFESFADKMLAKVQQAEMAAELKEVAPTLAGIDRQMPYYVPAGYFEQSLPQPWLQRDGSAKAAVRSMGGRRWLQIAAAVVVLLAAFGIWRNTGNTTNSQDYSQPEIAIVADTLPAPADISNQLAFIDLAALHEAYEEATITTSSVSATDDNLSVESLIMHTDNFEAALQNFGAEELQEHLSTLPSLVTE